MTLALDTNVIVDIVRNRSPDIRRRFAVALDSEDEIVASLIVLYELRLGCELNRDPVGELERVRRVLRNLVVEPLDQRDVVSAARIAAALKRRGRPIGAFDLLIAGQALQRGWTLVTANTREFGRIDGLNVIDWTVGSD